MKDTGAKTHSCEYIQKLDRFYFFIQQCRYLRIEIITMSIVVVKEYEGTNSSPRATIGSI